MRGVVIFIVIVTVSSVRSRHPQSKGENNRVKGGTPVTQDFDPNTLGPTKTKKGKRPDRIRNIDVNYIKTVGADIGLRGLAEANNNDYKDYNSNGRPSKIYSPKQTGEPPGYASKGNYNSNGGTVVNNGRSYNTNPKIGAGTDNGAYNNRLNQNNQPTTETKLSLKNIKGTDSNNFIPNKAFMANLFNTLITGNQRQDFKKTTMINDFRNQVPSSGSEKTAKHTWESYTNEGFNQFNNRDYLRPELHPPVLQRDLKPDTQSRKITKSVSWESLQSQVPTENDIQPKDTSNSYTFGNELLTNNAKQQKTKLSLNTNPQPNQYAQAEAYDPWKPDFGISKRKDYNVDNKSNNRNDNSKTKSNTSTLRTDRKYVGEGVDFGKIKYGNSNPSNTNTNQYQVPSESKENYGTLHKSIQSNSNFGRVDLQERAQKSEKASKLTSQKLAYNKPDLSDYFQSNYKDYNKDVNTGNKKPDLSKPDFGRPDQQNPSKHFNEPTKPVKSDFNFGKPEQPQPAKLDSYSNNNNVAVGNGKPDISQPSFGRPDKHDTSIKGLVNLSKQEKSKTYLKETQYSKSGFKDIGVESSVTSQARLNTNSVSDFSNLDQQNANVVFETMKKLYQLKNLKPVHEKFDFGRPEKAEITATNYGKQTKRDYTNSDKQDPLTLDNRKPNNPIPDFGRPVKEETNSKKHESTFNKKQSKPNFGRPDRQEILKKPIQLKADFGRPEAVDSIKPTPGQDNKHFGKSGNPRRPQDKLVPKTISESSKPEFGRPEKTDRKINDNKSRRKGDFFSPDFVKPRRQNAKRKPVKTKAYIGKVENSRIAKQDYETVRKELNIDYKQPDLSTPDFGRPDQQELSSKAHVIDITQKGKPDLSKQDFVGLDTQQPSKQGNDQLPNLNIPMFDFGTPDLRDLKKTSSKAFENTNINNGKPDLSQTKFGRPEKVESTKRIHDKLSKQKKVPDFSRPDQQDVSNQNSKANVQNINTYNGNSDLPQPKFETPDRVYLAKQSKDKFPKQTVSTSKFGRREQQDPNLKIYATDPFVNERNLDLTQQTFGIPDKRDPIKQSNDKQSKEKEPKFGFGRSYQQSSNLYVGGLQVNNIKSDLSIPEFGRPDKPDPTKQVNEKRSKPKESTFDIGRQDNLDTANQNLKAFTTDAYKNTVQSDLSQPVFNRLDESVHTKQGYDTFSKQKVQNFNFVRPEQAQLSKTGSQPYATDAYIDKGKPNLSQPDFGRPDKRGPSKEGKRENGQKFDFSSPDRLDVGKKGSTVIAKDIKTNIGKPDMFMPDFGRKWDVPDFSKRGNTNYAKQKVSSFDFGRPDNHDIGKQNLNAYRPDAYVTKGTPDLSKPEFGRPEKTDPSNKGYDTLEKQNPTIFDFGKPHQPDLSKQNLNEFSKNAYSNNGKLDLSKPEFGRPDKPDPTKQGYDTYSKQTGRTDFSRPVSSDTGEQVSKPYAKDANVNNGSPDLTQFTLARSNKPDSTKHLNVPTHDLRRPDQTPNYALENQISKKPESKNAFDYSSLEQHNANILETFKNLYQVKNTQTELNKPDFGRPEMNTNTGATGHERVKTADTINPSYNNNNVPAFDRLGFGRPDKQDTLKQTYGKAITENVSKLDLSRLEKQSKQGSNLNQKAMLISNENLKLAKPDFGRPDKPDPTKMGFDNFSKQKLPNVDFGRPDQLETGKQGSKGSENSPKRQMAESHSNQHQEQYLAYQDSQNSAKDMTADYGKHDSFKADFGRPHKTKQSFYTNSDNAVIDNRNQDLQKPELGGIDESYPLSKKVIERPKFDRTDQPYSGKQGFKTNNNNKAEEYGNIDLAKPDFGRPENPSVKGYRSSTVDTHIGNHGLSRADKSDSSVNSFHISEKKESIKPDFARPDKQDTLKRGHKSSRNNGVADYRKKDMFQPDFGRPDKQNRKIKVKKTHLPIEITKPEFGRPDQIDKTIQNFKGNEIGDYRNIDMSKPDFGRPDLSDPTVEAYPNNVKNGVETIDIGRPDQNQNQKSDKLYKQMIEETPSVIKVKTPDFGRPDKSDITKQSYTISKGSEVNNYRNIDMSKPDFGRPDLSDPTVEAYPNNIKNGVETNGIGRPDQKDMTRQNNKLADNNGDYRNLDIPKQEIRKPDIPKIYVNQYNAPIKSAATTSEFRKLDKSDKQMLVQETPSMKKVKKPEFGRPEQSDVKKQSYTISKGNEVDNYRNIDMSTPDFGRPDLPDPVVKAYPNNFKNRVETIDKGGHDQKDMTRQNYKATSNNGDYRNLDIPKQEIRTPNIPKISVNPYKAPTKTAATTTEFQKSDKPYKQMIEETHSVIKVKTPDFGRPDKSDITKQSYTISKGSEVGDYRNIDMSKPDFAGPDLSGSTIKAYPTTLKNGVKTINQLDMTRQNEKATTYKEVGERRKLDLPKPEFERPDVYIPSFKAQESPIKTAATKPEFHRPDKPDRKVIVKNMPSMKTLETPEYGRPDLQDITKQTFKGNKVGDNRNIDMSVPDFGRPESSDLTVKAYPPLVKKGIKTIDIVRNDQLYMARQNNRATSNNNGPGDYRKLDIPNQDFGIDILDQSYKETSNNGIEENRKLDIPKQDFGRPSKTDQTVKANKAATKTVVTKPEFRRPDKPDRKVIVLQAPLTHEISKPEFGRPDQPDITKPSYKISKVNEVSDYKNSEISKPDFNRPDLSDPTMETYASAVQKGIKTIDIGKLDQVDVTKQSYKMTHNDNGLGDIIKPDKPKMDFGRPEKPDQTITANEAVSKTVVTKPDFERRIEHDILKQNDKISQNDRGENYRKLNIVKPGLSRPDNYDHSMKAYKKLTAKMTEINYSDKTKSAKSKLSRNDRVQKHQELDIPKPDFRRPEKSDLTLKGKPDTTLQSYILPSKTETYNTDFGKHGERNNGATKLPTKANRPFNLSGLDQQKAQSVLQTLKKLYLAKLSNTGTREIDFGRPDQQDLTNINNVNNNKPREPKPNKPVKTLPDFGKPEKPEQENSNNGKLNPIQARPEYGTLVKQKVTLSNAIKPAHPILTKPDLSRSDRADVINYGSQNDIVPSKPDFGRPDPIERNSSPSSKSIFTKQDFTRPDKLDRARDINDLPRKSVPVNSFFEKHDQTKTKQIPNTKIPNKNLNDLHAVKLDFARPDQSESANPTSKTPDKYIYVRKQELSKPEFSRPDRPDSRKQVNEQLLNTAHVNREQAASVANLAAKPDRNQYSSKTTNSFNFSNLSQQKANLVLQALKKLRLSKDQISTPTKVNKDSPDKHARLFSNENNNKPQASQVYENLDQPGFSKSNAIQISKPDFGRPDELQIPNANDYKRPHSTQSKPDFRRQDKPDVSKQNYETWNKPVRNRPDFARPSQSDRENRNDIPIGNSKPPKTTFERYNKADLSHGQIASYAPVQKSSLVLQKLRKIYQDNQENSNQIASAQQNSFAGWDQLKDSQSSEQVIGSTQKAGLRTTNNLQYNRKSENQATTLLPQNVNTKTRNENDMQNIILPTKLKSGKPYFSERKYASDQGISFKNIPDTRNSFTPEKSENNSPIVSSSNKARQNANELNKAKKTTVAIKTQPYSSYKGVTSGPRDRVTSAPKVVQPYDSQRHAGVQREVQKPKKPVYDIGKAYSTSKEVAGKGGSKVNCSVIFPICGDDDFTYLSECFLPSTVKKLCNGFCPCAAPGQEAGPATLLVPGSPTSKDSLSKTVANPGKPARIQLFDHNPNKFQNEQTAQSGKQTLESVPRKQSPYKKSSDSLCELKCRGAKLSPVCTTLGITRDNECIQKCRGEITACDGACPCRPDRRDGGLARHLNDKAVFDRNIKDNANMATLGIMSNSDEHGSFDTR